MAQERFLCCTDFGAYLYRWCVRAALARRMFSASAAWRRGVASQPRNLRLRNGGGGVTNQPGEKAKKRMA
jgi:hypothetical protein